MRITERKLRKIIRSIVAESSHGNENESLSQFIMSNLEWLHKSPEDVEDHPFEDYFGKWTISHATGDAFTEAIQCKLDECSSRRGGYGAPSKLAYALVNELDNSPEQLRRFLDIIDDACKMR